MAETKLHNTVFTLESVAHLRGLESVCLPQADFVKRLDKALKRMMTDGPTSGAILELRTLAVENQGE